MTRLRALAFGIAGLAVLGLGGAVVAGGMQQSAPQEARPADPIGDILRNAPAPAAQEAPPSAAPAPAAPVAVAPPPVEIATAPLESAPPEADAPPEEAAKPEEKIQEPDKPERRQRRRVAIVEAIDKITAERMRFEVEVGGRPVRFNKSLIFTARACEVSAPGELVSDAIAYLDISLQARGTNSGEARQVFRGWMFASTPGVSGLQHPLYDAWVVGCKA